MGAGKIQGKISEYCDRNDFPYNKLAVGSRSGWGDCLVVVCGVTYYFEVKYGKDKESPLQEMVRGRLNRHYRIAFVIRNIEEFYDIMSRIRGQNG